MSRARILDPFPFLTARAAGARVVDVDGNEYIDCAMGFGCHLLGHAHPVVVEAIRESVLEGTGYGTPHPREARLAELLVDSIACADKVTFANSGSEATLNAIRIARGFTGKSGIAKFEGGYHGWYDAMLGSVYHDPAASGAIDEPAFFSHSIGVPAENLAHTYALPFNHEAAFERIRSLSDKLAVVLVEAGSGSWRSHPQRIAHGCTGCAEFVASAASCCSSTRSLPAIAWRVAAPRKPMASRQTWRPTARWWAPGCRLASSPAPNRSWECSGPPETRLAIYATRSTTAAPSTAPCPSWRWGIAVLEYLEEHPEVYGRLNDLGATLRQGLTEMIAAGGYPATVLGTGSDVHAPVHRTSGA